MSFDDLSGLRELANLRRAVNGGTSAIDTDRVSQDFLHFSSFMEKKALTVKLPTMYALGDDKKKQCAEALDVLNLGQAPTSVDISGSWEGVEDYVFFFSVLQKDADHRSYYRSSLNPLLAKVFTQGFELLSDFTIHEVLYGKVVAQRGALDLKEAHLFPERFSRGPYQLSVKLDTVHSTVSEFQAFDILLKQVSDNPKLALLDPRKIDQLVEKASTLRSRLGSLSRYAVPTSNYIVAESNAVIVNLGGTELFYLFSETQRKNAVVYFGVDPFSGKAMKDLDILDGNRPDAVAQLLGMGMLDINPSVLDMRLANLEKAYEGAARGLARPIKDAYPDFDSLLDKLKEVQHYFARVVNPDSRRNYCARLAPELLEFLVHPATDNPVVHVLVPRLSWNATMREYHNTAGFIKQFDESDEGRKKLLDDVVSSILFANQQNNDVNVWLYNNHYPFCESAGIEFQKL